MGGKRPPNTKVFLNVFSFFCLLRFGETFFMEKKLSKIFKKKLVLSYFNFLEYSATHFDLVASKIGEFEHRVSEWMKHLAANRLVPGSRTAMSICHPSFIKLTDHIENLHPITIGPRSILTDSLRHYLGYRSLLFCYF